MISNSNKRSHTTSDDEGNVPPIKKPKIVTIDATALKLEEINAHCLLRIASYLTPMDLVNLRQTSPCLMSIVQQAFEKRSKFVGIGKKAKSVGEEHLPIVLQIMGPFIRKIHWTDIGARQLEYLSRYCGKANRLTLVSASLVCRNIDAEKIIFTHIHTLCLERCSSLYDNAMIKVVNASSHLTQLSLFHCPNIKGKFFYKWKCCRLTYLHISGNAPLRSLFLSIYETGGQLMTLKILSLDCEGLQTDEEIEKLRSLERLQYLSLRNVDNQLVNRLYSSLHEYIPQIEGLKVYTTRESTTLTSISELVSSFAHLKKFSHSLMTPELLLLICEAREIKKQPIEIGVSQEMFNDPKQMDFAAANKHVVKLTLRHKLFY